MKLLEKFGKRWKNKKEDNRVEEQAILDEEGMGTIQLTEINEYVLKEMKENEKEKSKLADEVRKVLNDNNAEAYSGSCSPSIGSDI